MKKNTSMVLMALFAASLSSPAQAGIVQDKKAIKAADAESDSIKNQVNSIDDALPNVDINEDDPSNGRVDVAHYRADLKNQKTNSEASIASLNTQSSDYDGQSQAAQEELATLQQSVTDTQAEEDAAKADFQAAQEKATQVNNELDGVTKRTELLNTAVANAQEALAREVAEAEAKEAEAKQAADAARAKQAAAAAASGPGGRGGGF